jgi:hypothetical protein
MIIHGDFEVRKKNDEITVYIPKETTLKEMAAMVMFKWGKKMMESLCTFPRRLF